MVQPGQFYDFDLDQSAEKRWGPIFDCYQNHLENFTQEIEKILQGFGLAVPLMKPVYDAFPKSKIMFLDEIRYISKRIGIPEHKVLLMQLIYETSSACTTTVLEYGTTEFFFRTMDWPMPFLKKMTIGLSLKKSGVEIGKVVTWLGYVGFLTAYNAIHNYSISINYRRTEPISLTSLVKNFGRTVSTKWPIGNLVREIMENSRDVYTAKCLLEKTELISPCYIIMYVPCYQTYIITRDCDKLVGTRTDKLIQTNYDIDKTEPNIFWSNERKQHIQKVQDELTQMCYSNETITNGLILDMLLKHPIENEDTIYVYYQSGKEMGFYILS